MYQRHRRFWIVLVAMILAAPSVARAADAPNAPLLRYGFQAGRKHVYDVAIRADLDDYEEIYKGLLTWSVRSATEKQVVLDHDGTLESDIKRRPGTFVLPHVRFPRTRFRSFDEREGMTVDRQGKLIVSHELESLPFLLGSQELLVLEELPAQAEPAWEKHREVSIHRQESSGFPMPPMMPFGRRSEGGNRHAAKEEIHYKIAEVKDGTVRVSKRYSLHTDPSDSTSPMGMTGEGEFVFDLKQGVIQSLSMKYEVQATEGNKSQKIPLTVSCKLLGPDELARRQSETQTSPGKQNALGKKAAHTKPLERGERDRLLADLKSKEDRVAVAAAVKFAFASRDDHPEEVAKALAALLGRTHDLTKRFVAKALVVWATPDAEPALIEASKNENSGARDAAIAALGTLKSEAAARAVAAQLSRSREEAATALKNMGPVAEAATLEYLKNSRDIAANRRICQLLAETGGKNSLAALEEYLPQSLSWLDRDDVKAAVDAIRQRMRLPPAPATASKPTVADAKPAAPGPTPTVAATKPAASFRKWRDVSGTYEVEAAYEGVYERKTRLHCKDGRTLNVPLERLSKEDQAYVAEQMKKAKPANPFE